MPRSLLHILHLSLILGSIFLSDNVKGFQERGIYLVSRLTSANGDNNRHTHLSSSLTATHHHKKLQLPHRSNRPLHSTSTGTTSPSPLSSVSKADEEVALFGAGCFWAPADSYSRLPGVISVTVGYAGDDTVTSPPSYDTVCYGRTRLVETVRVTYDPSIISYKDLLAEFDRVKSVQPGGKRQYAGIVFVDDDEGRKEEAERWLEEMKRVNRVNAASVTIEDAPQTFWVAEKYHQNFWGKWRPRILLGVVLLALQTPSVIDNDSVNGLATAVYLLGILAVVLERRIDANVMKL